MEIEAEGKIIRLPRRRERCLLGVLLLEANRVVPVTRLADLLWDDSTPKQTRGAIQGYVSRLRSTLANVSSGHDVELAFTAGGYQLGVDPQAVDACQFRILLERAAASIDPVGRVDLLRTALDLWRGPVLVDAANGWTRDQLCSDLEEQRLAATEEFMAVSLALRREREVLPELTRVANAHPGRERLVGLLMRAFYQCGRRAEALAAYQRTRTFLAEELGLDPGVELRDLHQAILRDELALPAPEGGEASGTTSSLVFRVVPRQLPADVSGFTGRVEYLHRLDGLLRAGADAGSVVSAVIGGTAGVGKTALAVHWAHQVAGKFPDGQLFIDLHGFSTAAPPVEPADALDRMLRALGLRGERIPANMDDRAALWRSTLAGRRVLIVLDNAATPAQVSPLLPGAPGCLVLVTSRRGLAGLEVTLRMSLDMMPLPEAQALFARTAGEDRVASQSQASIVETLELCGRLPLAIRIAAGRLRSHPVWRVADLVERLRDEDHRLAELADESRGVASALDLSYEQCTAEQQRLYRLLGFHPGVEIEPYAMAALAGIGVVAARRGLDQLLDAHLLQETAAGRFVLHDLVRAHAASIAVEHGIDSPRGAAPGRRLLDFYRFTASIATDVAYPFERRRRPDRKSVV